MGCSANITCCILSDCVSPALTPASCMAVCVPPNPDPVCNRILHNLMVKLRSPLCCSSAKHDTAGMTYRSALQLHSWLFSPSGRCDRLGGQKLCVAKPDTDCHHQDMSFLVQRCARPCCSLTAALSSRSIKHFASHPSPEGISICAAA